MAVTRGKDFKLYYNTDESYATPSWEEVTNVRDLTRNLESALADASVRGSIFRLQVPTLKDFSLEFQMVYDPTDDAFSDFEAAYFEDEEVEFLVLDGDIDDIGSRGIRFEGLISNFTNNEALEDVGLTDVTVVPGYVPENPPRRVEVASAGSVTDVT